jgi:hypothetical protein
MIKQRLKKSCPAAVKVTFRGVLSSSTAFKWLSSLVILLETAEAVRFNSFAAIEKLLDFPTSTNVRI